MLTVPNRTREDNFYIKSEHRIEVLRTFLEEHSNQIVVSRKNKEELYQNNLALLRTKAEDDDDTIKNETNMRKCLK